MISNNFRLMLLRHGNTFNAGEIATQIGCKTDLPLTEKGLIQAKTFADYLKSHQLSPFSINSGSLQRQVETAKIIHAIFPNAHLFTHQHALDEIDYGAWEGLSSQDIKDKWPSEYQNWCEQGIWPEHVFNKTKQDHLTLLEQWFENLSKNTPSQSLVIAVSSNGLMRLMLHFMPELCNALVQNKKMDTYKVATGHYCDLTFNQQKPTIQQWNCSPELFL